MSRSSVDKMPFLWKRKKSPVQVESPELQKFRAAYEKLESKFNQAKKLACEKRLKTACILQAQGLVALHDLVTRYDVVAFHEGIAAQINLKLCEEEEHLEEWKPKAVQMSAQIWERVLEKDQKHAWSYSKLPFLHEIFTHTDSVLFPLPKKTEQLPMAPRMEDSEAQSKRQMKIKNDSEASLEELMELVPDSPVFPTEVEIIEALRSLRRNREDEEAKAVIKRCESRVLPIRWQSPEVSELAQKPENLIFQKFMGSLRRNKVNFHQIYGYLEQKASLMDNVVMRAKSIHHGLKREGGVEKIAHRGVLLHGPSGTGKTCLVRACATALLDTVVYFELTKSHLLDKYFGQSEQNLLKLFEFADLVGPSIIFIDEGEELFGNKEKTNAHDVSKNMASSLLNIMTDNYNVQVICATNLPWAMEPSFRRRFTLKLHVGLPNKEERALIIKHLLRNQFCLITDDEYQELGERTAGFSGGDIEIVVYDVINKKESEGGDFRQECPIRSSHSNPVWMPCGPYSNNSIKMSKEMNAVLGQRSESRPITMSCVIAAISKHVKTVPERLVEHHIQYSKDNDFKPPEKKIEITHHHPDIKK